MRTDVTTLLSDLEKSAFAGDPTAKMVLEHPITNYLLKELVEKPYPSYIRIDARFTSDNIFKDGKRRLIGGYASVEVIDKQNELITLPALQNALTKMVAAGEKYANVNLEHSNITLGKILLGEHIKDSQGKDHYTHVDDRGLYVLCELRDDLEIANRVWDMACKGELNAFSIGGRCLKRRPVAKGSMGPFWQIDDIELYEVTICKRGKNTLSGFEVLKSYKDMGLIDEATFIAKSAELSKGEQILKELSIMPNILNKTFILRENFVCQADIIAKGDSHSVDLIVKMDAENPLRRQIQTQFSKAIPAECWPDLGYVFGTDASAYPDATPLFHLALIPVAKADPVPAAAGVDGAIALIEQKPEGHKSKPKEYVHIPDDQFADPANFKYPLDEEHVQAAWNYLHVDKNREAGGYSEAEWSEMKGKAKAAMKKFGHEVAEEQEKASTEQSTVTLESNVDRTLKNIDSRERSTEDENLSNIAKTIGTQEIVGTGTGPSEGNKVGTSTTGPAIASRKTRVAKMEELLKKAGMDPAAITDDPPEKEAACPPAPEKEAAFPPAAAAPVAPQKEAAFPPAAAEAPEKDAEAAAKEAAAKEAAAKEAASKEVMDEAALKSLLDLDAKGLLPAEMSKMVQKMAEKAHISKSDLKMEKLEKAVENLTKLVQDSLTIQKSAHLPTAAEVAENLKHQASTIRKSASTPGAGPEEIGAPAPTVTGPRTLQEMYKTPFGQVHNLNDRRNQIMNSGAS